MKKFLLLVAAVCSLAATAQTKTPRVQLQREPVAVKKSAFNLKPARRMATKRQADGEWTYWSMDAYVNTYYGDIFQSGMVVKTKDSGLKCLFDGVFPGIEETLSANKSFDGMKYTFKKDQVQYVMDYYGEDLEMRVAGFTMDDIDDAGYVTQYRDVVLVKGDDGTMQPDVEELYVALVTTYQGSEALYTYICEPVFTAVTLPELVTAPAGAEVKDYVFDYVDGYERRTLDLGQVAVDGNDYYFKGLALVSDAWVKGTKEGSKITVPAGQFLGVESGFYGYFMPVQESGVDEDGYATIEPMEALTFTVGDDGVLKLDEGTARAYATEATVDGSFLGIVSSVVAKPYTGDVAATPTDPFNFGIYLYEEDPGTGYDCFAFSYVNVGTNGEFLNKEKLYYRFYIDEDVYEICDDPYAYEDMDLSTPVTEMPVLYYGYDFMSDGCEAQVYFYESLLESIGVQMVYKLDGQEYCSNIVSGTLTGVKNVLDNQRSLTSYYDLQGRRLQEAPAKGLYIKDGKKYLVK